MKLIYKTKPLKFPTPQDLQNAMDAYLKNLENENKPTEYIYCSNCNKRFSLDEEPICCDEQHLVHCYEEVKAQDLLRPSLYGFCAWAGIHKQTLFDYKEREGYAEIYNWFLSILQMDLEQILLNPGTRNIGGAKFVAVNNYGWKDKTDVEHTGTQPITFVNNLPNTSINDDEIDDQNDS